MLRVQFELDITWSINQHVNNMKYVGYILDVILNFTIYYVRHILLDFLHYHVYVYHYLDTQNLHMYQYNINHVCFVY